MRLLRKNLLEKLKNKNRGNIQLTKAIQNLVNAIEENNWKTKEEIKIDRPDADQVHSDGFYFFDLSIHRTLVLITLDKDGTATVIWVGTHDDYERIFKNSKNTIKKYLSDNGWI